MIKIQNASFGYNKKPILSDVSLEIQRGEFVGLIGPNGAGKTTLLRGLTGLITPFSGNVIPSSVIKNRVGYVPQRDQLDSNFPLTAMDVVNMGVTAHQPWYKFLNKTIQDAAIHALSKVGMEKFSSHSFDTLSGGQRQRVLMARALSLNPVMMVLDEPTAGIDKENEDRILELLKQLSREENLTILMVSHHMESLASVADRLISVNEGQVRINHV